MKMEITEVEGITLVRPEETYGCGIACLAMVLDFTYRQVRSVWHRDFEKDGMQWKDYQGYLSDHGCSILEKRNGPANNSRSQQMQDAMLTPFAPIHIVSIQQSFDGKMNHGVVMDATGQLYDPEGHGDDEIRRSVYIIPAVFGIWRPQDHVNSNVT